MRKRGDVIANRISTIIDFSTDQAKTGLSGFKNAVNDAEGATGKFKAGFASVKDSITANAGAIALGAGAALVTFGAKAVGAFTDTAKAALDLKAATGLTTDEASRWIAVADDFEISGEQLTAGLGKIGKSLDSGKWEKYGVATRDAGGNARSTNDILLDSLSMLSRTTNETERAKIGNELFGKGYANLAPLIGHTRAEYEGMLGTVEDGQVVTAAEARKAEKWRLAMDDLGDAFKDLTIKVGENLAGLAPWVEKLTQVVGLIGQDNLGGDIRDTLAELGPLNDEIRKGTHDITYWIEQIDDGKITLEQAKEAIHDATLSTEELTEKQKNQAASQELMRINTGQARDATHDLEAAQEDLAAATAEATRRSDVHAASLKNQQDKLNDLYASERSAVDAKFAYRDATAEALIKVDELNKTLKDHKAGTEEANVAVLAARDAALDASASYATMEGAAIDSEGGIRRQIDSLVAQRDALAPDSPLRAFLQEYIDALNAIPSNISTIMDLHISSGQVTTKDGDLIGARYKPRAKGGPVSAGGAYVVGEQGPEVLQMGSQSGTIIPNGGGGDTFVINPPVGFNDRDLMRALQKLKARNGPAFLAS